MSPEKIKKRQEIESYFRRVAAEENNKNQKVAFDALLNPEDKKRVLYVMPESIGDIFLSTALFQDIRRRYPKPEWSFYVATNQQYFSLLDMNPYIDKVIPYIQQMDNIVWLEGQGGHKGYFDVAYLAHLGTQRMLNYMHNGQDKHGLELNT